MKVLRQKISNFEFYIFTEIHLNRRHFVFLYLRIFRQIRKYANTVLQTKIGISLSSRITRSLLITIGKIIMRIVILVFLCIYCMVGDGDTQTFGITGSTHSGSSNFDPCSGLILLSASSTSVTIKADLSTSSEYIDFYANDFKFGRCHTGDQCPSSYQNCGLSYSNIPIVNNMVAIDFLASATVNYCTTQVRVFFTYFCGTPDPTSQPSRQPSQQPTSHPSRQPSTRPSAQPSRKPSGQPSSQPPRQPNSSPSSVPSGDPTVQPTRVPSSQPSRRPTAQPSCPPTSQPSHRPSSQPTCLPTRQPTLRVNRLPFRQFCSLTNPLFNRPQAQVVQQEHPTTKFLSFWLAFVVALRTTVFSSHWTTDFRTIDVPFLSTDRIYLESTEFTADWDSFLISNWFSLPRTNDPTECYSIRTAVCRSQCTTFHQSYCSTECKSFQSTHWTTN
jgi:hypothetical protein